MGYQELFQNMYARDRSVEIDDEYRIVSKVNGVETPLTGGVRVTQYFAYVGGLVKLAYQIKNERQNDEASGLAGEQYPLVLDAAYSNADDIHTLNISRELSNSVNQLIFALMKKDWQFAKDGLDGKISRMYQLVSVDDWEAKIEEVPV